MTWHIILLGAAICWWTGMDMARSNTQVYAVVLKQSSAGAKGPKVSPKNISKTITPPSPVWTVSDPTSATYSLGFLFLPDTAAVHLLQGSACCVFRDVLSHTLVVTSGYLSCCCINKASSLRERLLFKPLTGEVQLHWSPCYSGTC